MSKKIGKFIFWTPRILSMIFIGFLALMSMDVFVEGAGLLEMLVGFFMHNIPTLILLAVLLVSWKREIVGGVVFVLAGILYIVLIAGRLNDDWQEMFVSILLISGTAFLIGGLFLIGWIKKKKK